MEPQDPQPATADADGDESRSSFWRSRLPILILIAGLTYVGIQSYAARPKWSGDRFINLEEGLSTRSPVTQREYSVVYERPLQGEPEFVKALVVTAGRSGRRDPIAKGMLAWAVARGDEPIPVRFEDGMVVIHFVDFTPDRKPRRRVVRIRDTRP